MSMYSYGKFLKLILWSWFIQTFILIFPLFTGDYSNNSIFPIFQILFYSDLIIMVSLLLWAILEYQSEESVYPGIFSTFLIGAGAFVFITGAVSYRTLLGFFPPNALAEYFIPLYQMDNTNPSATIDFSAIENVINGVVVANVGLFLLSLGLTFTFQKRSTKVSIFLYGIGNLFLTFTIFLIPIKVPVAALFLLIIAFKVE